MQKPFQKLWCCNKPDDVEHIHSPLERAQRASWEFLALQEKADNPHELISNISLTVLNLNFNLSLLLQSFFFSIRGTRSLILKTVSFKEDRGIFTHAHDLHYLCSGLLDLAFVHQVEQSAENVQADGVFHVLVVVEDSH